MKTKNSLIYVGLILFISCASQTKLKGPISNIKHNIQKEAAIDAIKTVFKKHDFSVYEDETSKGSISFWDHTLVAATPNENGEYLQPVMSMGFNRGFAFMQTIYEVKVKGGKIQIAKTVAETGLPTRKVVPVEPVILQEIAEKIGGVVEKK